MLRVATPADATAIRAIYAPIVEHTAISFELVPPSIRELEGRIRGTLDTHPWLVWIEGGEVAGYAYAGPHRKREAYRWSCEVSAYVHAGHRRKGLGTRLYEGLFEILREQGLVRAYAGITLPNQASVRLHEGVGFRPVGVYEKVGYKFGTWHDVGWWQLTLREAERELRVPVPFGELG